MVGASAAQITVCIPTYRAAEFIGQTLASVARQTFADYRVILAIEPDAAADTVAAAREFLADDRFGYYVNDRKLGYAPNVRSLLERVQTPYFAVLPHDDMWHPRYLAAQLEQLAPRRDASAACTDMYSFGSATGFRYVTLADGSLGERVLSFFLAGAEGHPWRGLTRREALDQSFPDNRFDGFAVECEWTLHLLQRGPLVHVAEPLYLKRQPLAESQMSVSVGWRLRTSDQTLREALEHHRQVLLQRARAGLSVAESHIVELAAEAAMLRRWVMFSNGRFDFSAEEESRHARTVGACEADESVTASQVLCRVHVALSRYAMQRDRREAAVQHAQAAVDCAPDHAEALIQLTEALVRMGRVTDALTNLQRAAQLLPLAIGLAPLEARCAKLVDLLGQSPEGRLA